MAQEINRAGLAAMAAMALAVMAAGAPAARAEIDGHGPDAWRVNGVKANDKLNARMGPGTNFKVIDHFAPDERGLIQVTCVPYMTLGISEQLTEAERRALPPRWCLMRSADFQRNGWVAQRFITPDEGTPELPQPAGAAPAKATPAEAAPEGDVQGRQLRSMKQGY